MLSLALYIIGACLYSQWHDVRADAQKPFHLSGGNLCQELINCIVFCSLGFDSFLNGNVHFNDLDRTWFWERGLWRKSISGLRRQGVWIAHKLCLYQAIAGICICIKNSYRNRENGGITYSKQAASLSGNKRCSQIIYRTCIDQVMYQFNNSF